MAAFAGNGSGTVANGVELLVTAINANTKKHGAVASGFNNVTSNLVGDFKMSTNFTINSHTVAIASSYSELVTNINKAVADVEAKLNPTIQLLYLMIPEIRFLSQVQLVQQMLVLLLKLSVDLYNYKT